MKLWNNIQIVGFVCFGCLSDGLVVQTVLLILTLGQVDTSQVVQKNKITNISGQKEGKTNMDSELQNVKGEVWHFLAFCVCSWLSWELSKNPTQLPKMLTHFWSSSSPLRVFVHDSIPPSDGSAPASWAWMSWPTSWTLNVWLWSLIPDWLCPSFTLQISQVFVVMPK